MTIVCLGDSLTYGYEVKRSAAWPFLAGKTSGERILNKGVNGLMTAGMLACFAQDVIRENARIVLLMGGANDILSGLAPREPERNMATMIGRAKNVGIVPLVGIPVPFCPPIREDWAAMADFPAKTPEYETYIDNLRALAATEGCGIVDFRAGTTGFARDVGMDPRSLYTDGIHLNEAGHRLFADIFVLSLRKYGLLPTNGL